MHALAFHLRCPVSVIEQTMSAQEFMHWQAWLRAEQVGPEWDRLRHAEVMAAVHNGACERKGGGAFTAVDFLPKDAWHLPAAADPQAQAARLQRELQAMEEWFHQ